MNLQIYIPVVAALLGTLVGALTKELGVFLQYHREDKRVLKSVLFNQLDLWFELWRSDLSFSISTFTEEFRAGLINRGANPEQAKGLLDVPQAQIIALLSSIKVGEPQKLLERYQEAINKLAEVDPITAYEIGLKIDWDFREKINELVEQAKELEKIENNPPSDKAVLDNIITYATDSSIRNQISLFEEDMLRVSRRVGIWTWFRTRRMIREMEDMMRNSIKKHVDRFIEGLMRVAVEAQKANEKPEA